MCMSNGILCVVNVVNVKRYTVMHECQPQYQAYDLRRFLQQYTIGSEFWH